MISRQAFPLVKYEGRMFRAERQENFVTIQTNREKEVQVFKLHVKNLYEFKQLVDEMYKNELEVTSEENKDTI